MSTLTLPKPLFSSSAALPKEQRDQRLMMNHPLGTEAHGSQVVEQSQIEPRTKAPVSSPDELKSKNAKADSEGTRERDLALVERAKAGDSEAYRELVEEYQTRAHSIALGILGNYQDAEEIAQEAFVKAYKNLSSFRAQSSFYTWLYRIIFNLSIDLSRKAYRRSEIGMEDNTAIDTVAQYSDADSSRYMGTVSDPESEYRNQEIRQRFNEALAALSPDHRAVITLREIDGLSYAEISEVVACTKGTVMSRLHHARKKLQAALQELRPLATDEETVGRGKGDRGKAEGRKTVKRKGETKAGRRPTGVIGNRAE